MDKVEKGAFPILGVSFFALGLFNFVQGDDWIVWVILGVLFGGLSVFSWRRKR